MTNGRRIALIGCGSEKQDVAAPARELYTGQLFRKSRELAESRFDAWAILSARHYLVMPDRVLAPYSRSLDDVDPDGLRAWCAHVSYQVYMQFCHEQGPVTFTLFAGERYRYVFEGHPQKSGFVFRKFDFEVPMRGLGIGEQLKWLNVELARAA